MSDEVEIPPFVVLGIDPGKQSGAGLIYTSGDGDELLMHRVVDDNPFARDEVLEVAKARAIDREVRLAIVIEAHTPGGWSYRTSAGLAQRRGAWIESVKRAGIPASRIVGVVPSTWRKDVVGMGNAPPSAVRAYVHERFGLKRSNPNERDAVCMALWGANAPKVISVLPVTRRRGDV